METITISVSPDIAQAYYAANETEQQQLQILITAFFSQNPMGDSLDALIQEMQQQAAENGLTQDILDKILRDD